MRNKLNTGIFYSTREEAENAADRYSGHGTMVRVFCSISRMRNGEPAWGVQYR
nr:MAG TPA: hypothetical protein [Caudoviricetes sp.]